MGGGGATEEFRRDWRGDERANGVMAAVELRTKASVAFGSGDGGGGSVVDDEDAVGRGGIGGGGPRACLRI